MRLVTQIQSDQLEILRLQNQISTGRRISLPSEDAPAAVRAQSIQRLLELKAQTEVNLDTSLSYLDASDSAISGVATLLSDIRGLALSVAGTTVSDSAREVAAEEIRRALEQLADIGNQKFRGRYLFAGSRAGGAPFALEDALVTYSGNQGSLASFVDIDLPYATNVPGSEVFGSYSPGVRGEVDLNAILTRDTPLADLHRGAGVTPGSIVVSDGTNSRVIDISPAATIGDVADLIEANPPAGRTITARVTATGLRIDLDDAGGGNLTIREVGGGTTAAELGIYDPIGTGIGPIVGGDLDPPLRLTTRLDDIIGQRAVAYLDSDGLNNDVIVEARLAGPAANGVAVQLVDHDLLQAAAGLSAGSETATYSPVAVAARAALPLSGFGNNLLLTAGAAGTAFNNVRIELIGAGAVGNSATASYNAGTKTLTLSVDSTGATTVQTLVNAINAQGTFTAGYDNSDPVDGGYNPFAAVQGGDIGVVEGNTGNSGGAAGTIFVFIDPGSSTANGVVAAIQGDALVSSLFDARLNETDSSSSVSAGLGAVDIDSAAVLSGGSGEGLDRTSGLRIVNGGQTHVLTFDTAETIEDLLNVLNGSAAQVLAEIDPAGDRISIHSRLSGSDFHIGENGGATATQLGVRSLTEGTALAEMNYGRGIETAAGTDFTIQRRDGVRLDIDLDGAETLADVLALINDRLDNQNPATRVIARLAVTGNGIELFDNNAAPVATLQVEKAFQSHAAIQLGLIPDGQTIAAAQVPTTLTGSDRHPLEVSGAFNSLIRLYDAVTDFDPVAIQRAIELLDIDFDRVNFARAEIGARGRSLETLQTRIEDEDVLLRGALSGEIDTDLTEAISNYTARQAALEASLRLSALTFQLSLLDFL